MSQQCYSTLQVKDAYYTSAYIVGTPRYVHTFLFLCTVLYVIYYTFEVVKFHYLCCFIPLFLFLQPLEPPSSLLIVPDMAR